MPFRLIYRERQCYTESYCTLRKLISNFLTYVYDGGLAYKILIIQCFFPVYQFYIANAQCLWQVCHCLWCEILIHHTALCSAEAQSEYVRTFESLAFYFLTVNNYKISVEMALILQWIFLCAYLYICMLTWFLRHKLLPSFLCCASICLLLFLCKHRPLLWKTMFQ